MNVKAAACQSSSLIKTWRRTFSLEDLKLQKKCEDGALKKSLSSSSTIRSSKFPSALRDDLNYDYDNDNFDSLDKEIENFCPSVSSAMLKVANMRYCDIFSRQSMESDENSSPDIEKRVNFSIELVQHSTHPIPKKPTMSSEQSTEVYQPCTNTIIQLKPSSFSAFREISEVKQFERFPEEDKALDTAFDDKEAAKRDTPTE